MFDSKTQVAELGLNQPQLVFTLNLPCGTSVEDDVVWIQLEGCDTLYHLDYTSVPPLGALIKVHEHTLLRKSTFPDSLISIRPCKLADSQAR